MRRLVSLLGVTLRPVCLVTDVDTLLDVLRLSNWDVLALVLVLPGCPLFSNLGLPTQVQDVDVLFLDLAVTLRQSCLSLECTIPPVLDLRLIISAASVR